MIQLYSNPNIISNVDCEEDIDKSAHASDNIMIASMNSAEVMIPDATNNITNNF